MNIPALKTPTPGDKTLDYGTYSGLVQTARMFGGLTFEDNHFRVLSDGYTTTVSLNPIDTGYDGPFKVGGSNDNTATISAGYLVVQGAGQVHKFGDTTIQNVLATGIIWCRIFKPAWFILGYESLVSNPNMQDSSHAWVPIADVEVTGTQVSVGQQWQHGNINLSLAL